MAWRELITVALDSACESWDDVVECSLSEDELDTEFDEDFGLVEGKPFTLWTKNRVYFPVAYDGSEWVGSASRNPDKKHTEHIGDPYNSGV